jgi:hypothetical protein
VSGESRQPEHETGEDEHGAVVVGALLEAGGDAPPLFEAVEAPLDDIPTAVALAVEGERASRPVCATLALVRSLRDGVGNASLTEQGSAAGIAVALVGKQVGWALTGPSAPAGSEHADGVEHRLQLGAVVALAGRDDHREGAALAIAREMDLGGQPAPTPPQRLIWGGGPPFFSAVATRFRAPAACW